MVERGYGYFRDGYERVFVEAQGALSDCRMKIRAANSAAGTISGSTGMTPLSWGEAIDLTVAASPYGTCVSASSKAKVNDAGKGGENLRRFFEALDRRLPGARVGVSAPSQHQPYGWPQNGASYQNYTPFRQPAPPGTLGAVAAASLNGIIALFVGFSTLSMPDIGVQLGACMTTAAMLLILGAALIGAGSYKAGAVLCFIGGLITVPVGMLGAWAGSKAMENAKWRKENPWAAG